MSAFKQILKFVSDGTLEQCAQLYRAENRGEISGRLLRWLQEFQELGCSDSQAALLTAILGELANNAFDHNLGKWQDQVGCLISIEKLNDQIRFAVADRGQGIQASLQHVRPDIQDPGQILKIAFEDIISGRSPEKRGNGLKFVKHSFEQYGGIGLLCLSSGARYQLGSIESLVDLIKPNLKFYGTLVAIDWKC